MTRRQAMTGVLMLAVFGMVMLTPATVRSEFSYVMFTVAAAAAGLVLVLDGGRS